MPVLRFFEHFVPPRGFVSGDADLTPKSGTFHTANVEAHSKTN